MQDRLNDCVESVRRHDEANNSGPISDHMNHGCIISNTLEPWKTQVQQNVGKLGNFDALQLEEQTHQDDISVNKHDDNPMEVDVFSRKGMKGKETSIRATKVPRKLRKVTTGKEYCEQGAETPSYFEGECRNCGKYEHKAHCSHKASEASS